MYTYKGCEMKKIQDFRARSKVEMPKRVLLSYKLPAVQNDY